MNPFEQRVLLSSEECDKILAQHINFSTTVVYDNNQQQLDLKTVAKHRGLRKESVVELSPELKEMLLKKLSVLGINSIPSYNKVIKYDEGEECKKHTDKGTDLITGSRYKTIIIILSDSSEYEGGDLVVEGKENYIANRIKGNVVIFDSMLQHYVEMVNKGTRLAQVIWVTKEDFNIKNKLL